MVVKNVSENSNSPGNCCNSCQTQSRNNKNNGLCSDVVLLITCPKRSLQKNTYIIEIYFYFIKLENVYK